MVITSPNLECGHFEGHTFAIFASQFAPFIQPTCLPQDDLVKWSDDLLMFFHTNLRNPIKILYIGW
jgi:hypothetical protein